MSKKKLPDTSARDAEITRGVRILYRTKDLVRTESELSLALQNVSILKQKIKRLKRELKELQK